MKTRREAYAACLGWIRALAYNAMFSALDRSCVQSQLDRAIADLVGMYEGDAEAFARWGAENAYCLTVKQQERKMEHRNENGQLHREDGPAVEHADGSREWWYDGRHIGSCSGPEGSIETTTNTGDSVDALKTRVAALEKEFLNVLAVMEAEGKRLEAAYQACAADVACRDKLVACAERANEIAKGNAEAEKKHQATDGHDWVGVERSFNDGEIDKLRADLASAKARIAELTEWRPMETAPRDKTCFFAAFVDGSQPWVAYFDSPTSSEVYIEGSGSYPASQLRGWLPMPETQQRSNDKK